MTALDLEMENRKRLAKQVQANIEADLGKMPLLRMLSETTARAIIDGYVLRLVLSWDESIAITQERLSELQRDTNSIILFQL